VREHFFLLWNSWKFSYFDLLLVSTFELAVSRRAVRSLVTCYWVLFESWLVWSWSWSLHAMSHRRVWVVRFSQPATRNVQKGIRAVQKCQGKKICNITQELLSNGVLQHLKRSLPLVIQKKPPWRVPWASVVSNKLVTWFLSQNLIPNFKKKEPEQTNQVNPSNGL
jgi:hypothetical protein